jgi:3'-phosphoadenosine 5'-phosphosulfate sulfotransferase (PAPS reductase)/FAD synthetase
MKIKKIITDEEIEFYLSDLKSRFDGIDKSKFYLAYSGGKDSHFLYWFIKEYLKDDQIKIVANNTYMEHPEILARMTKYADLVTVPDMKPFDIKKNYGSPVFGKNQDEIIERYQNGSRAPSTMGYIHGIKNGGKTWFKLNNKAKDLLLSGKLHPVTIHCCTELKKKPAQKYELETGRKPILGVKGTEGLLRAAKYKSCFTKSGTFTPIYDLTDEMEDAIYVKHNIEIPEIYKTVKRTGCMGCPYGYKSGDTELELALLNPKRRAFVINYFQETYDVLGVRYNEEYLNLLVPPKENKDAKENDDRTKVPIT